MGTLQKLTQDHLDVIYKLAALGLGCTAIAKRLEEGLVTGTGARLSVVHVADASVQYHLDKDAGRAAIDAHRERLYGDARQHPSFWLGWRIQRLERIAAELEDLRKDDALTHAERARYYQLSVRTLGEVRQQLDAVKPTGAAASGGATRHLHLHGEVAGVIAQQMMELQQIGRLGPALQRIAAQSGSQDAPAATGEHDEQADPGEPPSGSDGSALGTHGVPPASPQKIAENTQSVEGGESDEG